MTPILFFFHMMVWSLTTSSALLAYPSHARCQIKHLADPSLTAASCTRALSQLLLQYPSPAIYSFSEIPSRNPRHIKIPLVQSSQDCTITVGLFYVPHVTERMSRIVATADMIIEDCVGTRQFSGGSLDVGTSGLWVDVAPSNDRRKHGMDPALFNHTVVQ